MAGGGTVGDGKLHEHGRKNVGLESKLRGEWALDHKYAGMVAKVEHTIEPERCAFLLCDCKLIWTYKKRGCGPGIRCLHLDKKFIAELVEMI